MIRKGDIYEYDISKCNISVSITFKLIDKETYDKLYNMSKKERAITFGCMLRDKVIDMEKFDNAIKVTVDHFKKINNLTEDDIDEIAKDAVWTKRRVINTVLNEYIEFKLKNEATSMFQFKSIKFYYNSRTGRLFQRGLGSKEYPIYTVIANAMQLAESGTPRSIYTYLHKAKLDYVNKKLEDKFYEKINKYDSLDIINSLIEDLI